jgi:large subunit ribosomal protein L11
MSINFKSNFLKSKSALKAVIFLKIKAHSAVAGPPIGATLGQYGIPAGPFCKSFNDRTLYISDDILLNVSLFLTVSGEYKFHITLPTTSFFFKRSMGLESGSNKPGILKIFLLNVKKPILTPYMVYEVLIYKENIIFSSINNLKSVIKKNEGSLKSMGFQIVN